MSDVNTTEHIGVILVNLGTPDKPTPQSIRRFLRHFLSDKRVIQLPKLLWLPILYGFILPFRPQKIAPLYTLIWGEGEGPMRTMGKQLVEALQVKLNTLPSRGQQYHVVQGMTYGNPSLQSAFEHLNNRGCKQIIILPLFPQYSDTTTAAAFDTIEKTLKKVRIDATLHFIRDYHAHPLYINALAKHIKKYWQEHKLNNTRLLMSFHGIPQRYADKGDPYPQQCETSAALVIEELRKDMDQLPQCLLAYQSRFGKAPWLQPYTDETLEAWAKEDCESVAVICPGFAVDCLETLEEIAIQNRKGFTEAGGKFYHYIPALNASEEHVDLFFDVIVNQDLKR